MKVRCANPACRQVFDAEPKASARSSVVADSAHGRPPADVYHFTCPHCGRQTQVPAK